MRTRRGALAFAGLVASLLLVWGATAGVLRSALQPSAALDQKNRDAERLVFYRLGAEDALRLLVPTDAEAVRLATHLVLPQGHAYAPERQYLYGLALQLVGPDGEVLLERSVFTRTRQSKADPVGGGWAREAAYTPDGSVELTDEREFVVELPAELRRRHGVLYVRPTGAPSGVVVRAYSRVDESARVLSLRGHDGAEAARGRIQRATYLPWEKLGAATQARLTRERWERLGAVGEAERDYTTLPVYRTDFRLPLVEVAEAGLERLGAGRAVAVNVQGPARLTLWLWRPPGGTAADAEAAAAAPGPLAVRTLGADGTERSWALPAPTREAPTGHPLELPAGVHSLVVHNPGAADLRYTLEGPPGAWFGPEEARPVAGGADGTAAALLPDVRVTDAWAAGPGCPALELDVPVEPGAPDTARLLRVDARALGGPAAGDVRLELVDAAGRSLGTAALPLTPAAAPLEAAALAPGHRGAVPCSGAPAPGPEAGLEVTPWPLAVSEAASARIFLPREARTVRVRASHPAAVSLLQHLPPADGPLLGAPYAGMPAPAAVSPGAPEAAAAAPRVRWRAAPLERRGWFALRPANHAALAAAGARVELQAQVRLERVSPDVGGSGVPRGVAVALAPADAPPTQELLEPWRPADADAEVDPTRSLSTRLSPGAPVHVVFDARAPSRPELRLGLAGAEGLGGEVELLLDGQPFHRARLTATRSRQLLPPLPPGVHELTLRADAPALTATLNRPPAPGAGDALRVRTAYRMPDGGLRVPVHKPGAGALSLNIVLYAQQRDAAAVPRVRVTLDGGRPARRTGTWVRSLTRAERELPVPAATREPGTSVGAPDTRWHPRTVAVRLGEDLAPGTHWVHVRPLDAKGELWARFFVFGAPPDSDGPQQWNRQGWELEDAP